MVGRKKPGEHRGHINIVKANGTRVNEVIFEYNWGIQEKTMTLKALTDYGETCRPDRPPTKPISA